MLRFVSVAVVALALTAPAFADTPPPAAAPEQAAAKTKDKDNKDGVVCRRETPTGSSIPVKICTTAEQRKGQGRAVQGAQEHMQGPVPVVPN